MSNLERDIREFMYFAYKIAIRRKELRGYKEDSILRDCYDIGKEAVEIIDVLSRGDIAYALDYPSDAPKYTIYSTPQESEEADFLEAYRHISDSEVRRKLIVLIKVLAESKELKYRR